MKHLANIKDNNIEFQNDDILYYDLKEKDGANVVVTIERRGRSTQQNRYYWGVLMAMLSNELTRETGERYTKRRINNLMESLFLKDTETDPTTGEEVGVIEKAKNLNTKEFENLCKNVREWANELNIYLPEPNEIK